MTDLSTLTLAEIEAMADRLGNAARTIREAMALMGGVSLQQSNTVPTVAQIAIPAAQSSPNPLLDAGELAERTRLLNQMRMNANAMNVDPGALSE